MDHRDAAALASAEPPPAGPAPVRAQDSPHEYPEDGATEGVVEGEPVAEPVGHGQDPLANRHDRQHCNRGMAQKRATPWSVPTSADVVARRAGGRRRINAARRRAALERQRGLLLLAQAGGWPLAAGRGGQARYARALGVSRATVCRDVRTVLEWMRQGPQPCPLCGSGAWTAGNPMASGTGDLAERVRQEIALVRHQLGLDGSPATATPATLPRSRVMVTRCG